LDPLLIRRSGLRLPLAHALPLSAGSQAFEGQGYTGFLPPDTVGDVGMLRYIQAVNAVEAQFVVYDKQGAVLAGPILLGSLWGPGTPCGDSGAGDPIVLYDHLAKRWLLSQFADDVTDPARGFLCVAISQTSDPVSGGWFVYSFSTPLFPDYPKLAVWPDAYYVSTNESSDVPVYALDRANMLIGQPARPFQRFLTLPLARNGLQALTPSGLAGSTLPPPGSPHYFIRHVDDELETSTPDPLLDFVEIWELRVDFAQPQLSNVSGPRFVAVSDYNATLCNQKAVCLPQPGTSQLLDQFSDVIMWRPQYRNHGTYESLVADWTVNADGAGTAGIRWVELRKLPGGVWTLFQEGTFSPDPTHRWMASSAMDAAGDIALGYSVTSPTVFPSIRYTGRRPSDPLGQMTEPETAVADGLSFQPQHGRWGDYSSMSIDPSDDCTFWYTNEYMRADGKWNTRIASFRFPTCVPEAPAFALQLASLLTLFGLIVVGREGGIPWERVREFPRRLQELVG